MYSSNNNASIVREDKITLTEASSGFSIEIYLLIELRGKRRNIERENKLSLCTLTHIIHSQIIFILISKGKSLQLILDEWKCWEKYLHLFLPLYYISFLSSSFLFPVDIIAPIPYDSQRNPVRASAHWIITVQLRELIIANIDNAWRRQPAHWRPERSLWATRTVEFYCF